jgi:hypothetical protein
MPSWLAPVLVAGVAVVTFAAFWIGGKPELGLMWGAISLAFGAVLVVGSRNDTIRILKGVDDDERTRTIEYKAMTVVSTVLTLALVALLLGSAVQGESGLVYGVLLVVMEVTRLAAVAILSRRG